ncbi:SGNH hydrolase-type esterase superfamily protein [Artemisia annua]|uniref:SGNH hydrolase-type esterase superfamily protein n=1 Tax=Artemisia annua TaxID=35608 RepID=A0A2U1PQG2_ARTAN|nr:SGNH hydrolase-type esterase superfamily protein [Artemisia annua]
MRPSIVLFGDSITEQSFQYGGWGASLTDTYSRKADIVIRGYSGYTTRWALLLLHHLFPAVKKECSPAMLIVLITPPPIDEEGRLEDAVSSYGEKAMKLPERTNEAAGDYANGCIEVAKEVGVSSINLWSKMQETDGWQKKFLNDGLHLTPDGNRFVYEEVLKVFNGASLTAPDMPSDFPHHSEIDPHNPEKVFQQRV